MKIYLLIKNIKISKNYGPGLEFEGELLNGKRWNGKGKEYNEYGKLIFEGEFLNGIKNGKGKEYDSYGKLIFEGEYKNGKRNGNGKEYIDNGYFIFSTYFFINFNINS